MDTNLDQDNHRELQQERDYLATVRDAIAAMLDLARYRVSSGDAISGDGYTAEVLGRMLRTQVKELTEEPGGPCYFGRLQFGSDPDAGEHKDQRYYIGRRHIADTAGNPLVIDWRAPVSQAFYQATPQQRQGGQTRRRYGWALGPNAPAQLTGFEDEQLNTATENRTPSKLMAQELERARIGPMRDIVATIQPDQDHLVRANIGTSLCIQGGPGTGKTAVGLHRAAYLLYTHRPQLARQGVILIGPNPTFLRYIRAVLPALGEVDIDQRTPDNFFEHQPVRAVDTPETEQLKHDSRMADVLYRAVHGNIAPDKAVTIVVPDRSARLRVASDTLASMVRTVRAEQLPYRIGRERIRSRIVDVLCRQAERRGQSPGATWTARVGRSRPVATALDQIWPNIRPAELLASLFSDPDRLAEAAEGILSTQEQAMLLWDRPARTTKTACWSAADLFLIDEIAGLIDHPQQFGHIIVDEAQDLSPMQCRALARRNTHGSMTVLGDLAQGTTVWAARSWAEQLECLGHPEAALTSLTRGFRTPSPVLAIANRLLPVLGASVPPTHAVREGGQLSFHPTTDLLRTAIAVTRTASSDEGSTAIITVENACDEVRQAFAAAGLVPDHTKDGGATASGDQDEARITVLPASVIKGLEYDTVILVEPADIVNAEPRGLNRLYVAITRAVGHLHIVHARPLPSCFDSFDDIGRRATAPGYRLRS